MTTELKQRVNEFSQPIGEAVPDWYGATPAAHTSLSGSYCRLEPISQTGHTADLFEAFSHDKTGEMWTYMPVGPFTELSFDEWMSWAFNSSDPLFFAIIDVLSQKAVGFASLMRIHRSRIHCLFTATTKNPSGHGNDVSHDAPCF